ncbi:transcriptional regulator, LacI family [Cellulomonas flavigena DSM 20109]|uniref:Transcriptional regulator, LacI family n=1 Tax=Cellulomonas flavigena (strain ATCC 482 / DSM 20109 / BCRC 11376 / JCM 18109 / NBRC 3775 / NCIMB 8073 / NRS 134) TaxID=446466 RepID=D5ULU3_CELFN|nr:LacI family DNA-binding transcriptional regulator [Cellulomonas flavigena]ADG76049.1 transcriptional regulator, LacI family [Cellulomonas flavigena DSM 20109]
MARAQDADTPRGAPTLRDVARVAGVSIKTVSEVVNRTGRVAPATSARVDAAVAALGYQPNLSARRLRSGSTGVIGLAVPELSTSGYFNELSALVVQVAAERGLTVLIEQTGGTREGELRALAGPRRSVMDGLLINAVALEEQDVAARGPLPPTVVLGERRLGGGLDHVTFANEEAARQATAHLIDLGRRRILVVAGDPARSASAARRLDGHRQALAAAGRTLDPALVRTVALWDHEAGYRAVVDACRTGQTFDAVFAVNDSLALGAMRGLHDEGVDVPGRVAVVGIDDVVEARFSNPRLTTVDPQRGTLAALAVATLAERIADPSREGVVHEIETHLQVRGSTSPDAELPASTFQSR